MTPARELEITKWVKLIPEATLSEYFETLQARELQKILTETRERLRESLPEIVDRVRMLESVKQNLINLKKKP